MKRVVPCLVLALTLSACQNEEPTVSSGIPQFTQTYDDQAGMVSYWRFDEGSGAIAYDYVDDNDGTILGGATWADGVCGQALSFDGVDDYVDFGNDLSLNSDIVTVEFWVKPHLKHGITLEKGAWKQDGWFLGYHDPANVCPECLFLHLSRPGYRIYRLTPYYSVPGDEWSFIAFVLTRSKLAFFIDGELSVEYDHSFDYWMNPDRHLTIGKHENYSWLFFKGLIDEVAIYDRALTAEEILERYEYSAAGCIMSVNIDIKPGSDPNCFNNDGHGVIPVAVLGSADFDVTQVDPATVALEGLSVAAKGKSNRLLAHVEDVNGDGFDDLVVQIEDADGTFTSGSGTATLTGNLLPEYGGTLIQGSDEICIVPPAECIDPPAGLVSWWSGDGHANDIVGDNHGTLQNGATFASGMVNEAFSFDGVDDYVQTAASYGETAALTIDAWVRTTASLQKIVSAGDADNNDGFATDLGFQEGRIDFYVNDYSTWTYPRIITDAAFNDGQWHHVAGVFNNTGGSVTDDLTIYVDGQEVPQSNDPFPNNPYNANTRVSFNSLRIGRSDRVDVGKFFAGEVDEVEIFNRALSAEEIQAIYEAGKAGKCKG